ncbi:hypothetical protein [Corynebacterium epidermidicanis]|uniref:DNA polymerase Y family protein n=1 Tax=Corynebacterium epidermidicanis TaxID=1050174 RepID=A0A0G3GMD1_9CORY|nr:hypothetical protein [Corynebacterium epidermidicanis]AKK02391.1 hypothetical protein CEPID_02555 [Corynebacterium epidermidicanis]
MSRNKTQDASRWQLDGWLTARGVTEDAELGDGIVELILTPLGVSAPEERSLWGGANERLEEVRRVASRVQSMLGVEAVCQPIAAGGESPVERVELVAFGEQRDPAQPADGSWPGAIPGPLPARARHPAAVVHLLSAEGNAVYVTADAVLSAPPAAISWGSYRASVIGWAGPWPVAGRWWEGDADSACARLQVVSDVGPRAFLLLWIAGRWRVEATYD